MESEADPSALDLTPLRQAAKRVLVVDDHALVLMGLRALLARQTWVERCLCARCGEEAVDLAFRYEPNVVLLDLLIGCESGLDVCRELTAAHPTVRTVLMSGTSRVSVSVARSAGAIGFVSKTAPPETLVDILWRAAEGRLAFDDTSRSPTVARLTPRELEVLREIARGASNPETALALHLSPHTVKEYCSSLYRKLEVRNRAEAVRAAQRLGLVE